MRITAVFFNPLRLLSLLTFETLVFYFPIGVYLPFCDYSISYLFYNFNIQTSKSSQLFFVQIVEIVHNDNKTLYKPIKI